MTSLPLVWGETPSPESILSGEARAAPIYRYWRDQYEIAAVDSLENLPQDDPDVVILAQPRAMDPADLATLDAWVRTGGDAIILTDPDLVWPSDLPFGDPRRPLASGMLSPLPGEWGRNDCPVFDRAGKSYDRRGCRFSQRRTVAGIGKAIASRERGCSLHRFSGPGPSRLHRRGEMKSSRFSRRQARMDSIWRLKLILMYFN